MTLFAGSKSVGKVFILSGVNGSVLGEVDAPKISNRSDVSFTFSVGASIANYLYVTKTDRSPVSTVSLIQLRNRVAKIPKNFLEKFGEAWLPCMYFMVEGNLSAITWKHVVVAYTTGSVSYTHLTLPTICSV